MPVKSSTEPKKSLSQVIAEHNSDPGALLDILRDAQEIHGYLSTAVMEEVADQLDIPVSRVYGVATFYTLLATEPKGKYIIRVCESPPCHIRGAVNILETLKEVLGVNPGETTEDKKFTLELTSCLGVCGVAPAMMIGDQVYGNLTPERVKEILKTYE
ncbi:MAG: NADH-quinone oxidoreductase subunit NuoE [Firmicutes bacterium]|nr:NADH-quinone oxidoreductase subunit NuoE [Bacillota bacterium]